MQDNVVSETHFRQSVSLCTFPLTPQASNQFPGPCFVYLDNYAGRNFTASVDCWGFLGGGGGKVKPFYHSKTITREGRGAGLRKCSFNQNYTPNCHIEEMRGGNVFKIIPHCVTYRALKIP